MSKEIKKITADEVYPVSMRRLGDRPNSSSAQGRGGMSSAELKGFMDKYPELVKERLNELIDICNADSKDGIAKAIKTPVINPETGNEFSLYDWFAYAKIYLKGDKGDTGVGIQSIEKRTGVVDFDDIMNGIDADHYRITLTNGEIFDFKIKNGKKGDKGDKGDKGESIEQITREASNTAQSVSYDSTTGATIEYTDKALIYKDSTTGEIKTHTYPAQLSLPILPGKYVSIDANANNDALEVKVDDTALALDYFKINKTAAYTVPAWTGTSVLHMRYTGGNTPNTLVSRYGQGDADFHRINAEYIGYAEGGDSIDFYTLFTNTRGSDYTIDKTPTDTGTLTTTQIGVLTAQYQAKNLRIIYDNQVYIRMDPLNYPDGTMNYVHIDSIQDGNSGYKASGKCFSITVSTRAWQVVDINFGGQTTHNIYMDDPASNATIMFTVQSNKSTNYSPNTISELAAVVERIGFIPCVVEPGTGAVKAGYITADNTKFTVKTDAEYNYTFNQVTVQDTVS